MLNENVVTTQTFDCSSVPVDQPFEAHYVNLLLPMVQLIQLHLGTHLPTLMSTLPSSFMSQSYLLGDGC